MAKVGLWLNLLGSIIITIFIVVVLPRVMATITDVIH
jgi:hypothetical protein